MPQAMAIKVVARSGCAGHILWAIPNCQSATEGTTDATSVIRKIRIAHSPAVTRYVIASKKVPYVLGQIRYSVNTTDCTPEISKRLRQRKFLQAIMSSRRSM